MSWPYIIYHGPSLWKHALNHRDGRHAQYIDHLAQLVHLICAGEKRSARVKFHQQTAQRPEIDLMTVRQSQQDFWGAVIPDV